MGKTLIARCKICKEGVVFMATADRRSHRKEAASLLVEGYDIETVDDEDIRSGKIRMCECELESTGRQLNMFEAEG